MHTGLAAYIDRFSKIHYSAAEQVPLPKRRQEEVEVALKAHRRGLADKIIAII